MKRPSPPSSSLARVLRAALGACALALVVSAADATPAFFTQVQFRPHDGNRGGNPGRAAMREQRVQRMSEQRAQRMERREQAPQQRPQEFREPPPQQRPVEQPQPQPEGRPGRLTPDERRALRQQINDAGREIYRPRRP